jgi:hypothetical protein
MRRLLPLLLLISLPLWGKSRFPQRAGDFRALSVADAWKVLTTNEVWTTLSNFGEHGDANTILPGYSWPGNAPGQNVYYLWDGRIWLAAFVNGVKYVTHYDYGEKEWAPSTDNLGTGFAWIGPDKSFMDVEARYDDWGSNPRYRNGSNGLGVKIIERIMGWPQYPYSQIYVYELGVIYNKSEARISPAPDTLEFFLGWQYDADVCGADNTEPHIDDLVYYDGAPEECAIFFTKNYKMGWEDSLTVLSDTTISGQDGIPDGYIIWGDDPWEKAITQAYYSARGIQGPDSFRLTRKKRDGSGDTTVYYYYLIPRNTSFIYDGDNPKEPGDDTGDNGLCPGYIGVMLIYAPPTSNDLTGTNISSSCYGITLAKAIDPSDNMRIIYPRAHQWWNWENDPGDDAARFDYMVGDHPATRPYRFAPHPYDMGANEFDYRFLLTTGPHKIADGDTLWFVVAGAVGYGLNGGKDDVWFGGSWKMGLRQAMEQALRAYYTGSEGHCDPAHPCGPKDAPHWRIPVPPSSPSLSYSAAGDSVILIWDKSPEYTPDPIKKEIDFAGYAIYRALYGPNFKDKPLKILVDATKPYKNSVKNFWRNVYPDVQIEEVSFAGTQNFYVDKTAPKGFPLYYAVTAFDWEPSINASLESSKDNYLKYPTGAPRPIFVGGSPGGDDWKNKIVVAPNPLKGWSKWSATRQTPEIKFFNIPAGARIDIYSATGDHIITLYNTSPSSGMVSWNLLTNRKMMVSPGIYYFRVVDSKGNDYVGKFVILR